MICLYHSADLDGICSAAIVIAALPGCRAIGIDYGQPVPWEAMIPGENVYLVDFSLPMEDMQRLSKRSLLHWIDHHKSAIEAAEAAGFLASGGQLLDSTQAACELTWAYVMHDTPMPVGVKLLGRYDVWDLNHNSDVLPYQYGMRSLSAASSPLDPQWWKVFDGNFEFNGFVRDRGRAILAYEDATNLKYADIAHETHICDLPAVAINRLLCNSRTFDHAYHPERHALMLAYGFDGQQWKVSLYSDQGSSVDVSEIARRFGGGGHAHAAGFRCDELPFALIQRVAE